MAYPSPDRDERGLSTRTGRTTNRLAMSGAVRKGWRTRALWVPTVVSGLATGIDGVAHAATVRAGGPMIAVIGPGQRLRAETLRSSSGPATGVAGRIVRTKVRRLSTGGFAISCSSILPVRTNGEPGSRVHEGWSSIEPSAR